jgi:Ca2+-dependent lipid-binding protein
MSGTLKVTIIEGRDLKDKDFLRKDDAYIEIYLDKDNRQKTTTIKDTDNPTWNETFIL